MEAMAVFALKSIKGGGGGGGGAATDADVLFIDYDGSIVKGYSAEEFAELTALPSNPSHTGLVAQGWNYTLADAQAYVAKYGSLVIGQQYDTADGKMHIYFTLTDGRLEPYLGIYLNGTAVVDWGDGSPTETMTETNNVARKQHTYASAGDYEITVDITGTAGISGTYGGSYLLAASTVSGAHYQNAIKRVELSSKVTELKEQAFDYCRNLESVSIPNSVTSVGPTVFRGCYKLTGLSLPSGLTLIGSDAFSACYSLKEIAIPKGVPAIGGTYVFSENRSLERLTLPEGITAINGSLCRLCAALKRVVIPDTVTSIATYAFAYTGLKSVVIPNGVTSVGNYAFAENYSLESVSLPNTLTTISDYAFLSCYRLKTISFPDTVTSLGTNVCCYDRSLEEVRIPSGIEDIKSTAFSYCESLSSVEIPEGVEVIAQSAFANTNGLMKLTIPESVTMIASSAFQNCVSLGWIKFKSSTPPTLASSNCFGSVAYCTIYVPAGSKTAYQTATNYPTSNITYEEY